MAADAEDLLRECVMDGFTNREIQIVLALEIGLEISLRSVKRMLQRLGLRRRKILDASLVQAALMEEIHGSGQRLGCRMMRHRLLGSHGISLSRDRILHLMHTLDPDGVAMRRRNRLTRRQYRNLGPNFMIHIDGYDKLKRYGLAIHGAVCGFSRKVLWLRVNRTNNDPDVVAAYFIDYLREISGVPRCIRVDAGTENVKVLNMQQALRWFHGDDRSGEKSVIVGSSHSNQRIEAWWRILRQMCTGFWMDFFKDVDAQGLLSTNSDVHMECLRFCFTQLLQKELDQVRSEWNNHRVRSSVDYAIEGKPNLLYCYPEIYGTRDYKFPVEPSDVDFMESTTKRLPVFGCLEDNAILFQQLLADNGKDLPSSCEEALYLYQWLIRHV